MAAATQSNQSSGASPMALVPASFLGALFVIAAFGLILRGIPYVWETSIETSLINATNSFVSNGLLVVTQIAGLIGLIVIGSRIGTGTSALKGIRGGIFLMISTFFTLFFCIKAIYLNSTIGLKFYPIVCIIFNMAIVLLVAQMFRTGRFSRWAVNIEDGGWFHTTTYKRTQGHRIRRMTILGLLIVGISGLFAMGNHNLLPSNSTVVVDGKEVSDRMGDWVVGGTLLKLDESTPPAERKSRPRVQGGLSVLPDLKLTVPLILFAGMVWFAWRLVNQPTFADFLIATEAEMNKVSWSSRRSLIRDTIVVIVTVLFITFFLLLVDTMWGKLFSRSFIGILPSDNEKPKVAPKDERQVDW
ncbi:MAG: preprotein translocase subunit SecE [Zavarzinella sp.]